MSHITVSTKQPSSKTREDKRVRELILHRPYPHGNPSFKNIFSNKIAANSNYRTLYLLTRETYFFFLSFEVLVTGSFRNSHKISHNTKSKI